MTRKIVWLLVSCLMVLSLVLASCAPAVIEEEKEEEKAPVVKEEKKPEVVKEEKVEKLVPAEQREPQYGGWINYVTDKNNPGWDQAIISPGSLFPPAMALQDLLIVDWAKGPGGTNETGLELAAFPTSEALVTGCLAESWEWNDPVTLVFHIRKGVYFHNKPPVNGRELTADDVVFSLERLYTVPTSLLRQNAPEGTIPSFNALDRYTVEVKFTDPGVATAQFQLIGINADIIPHEVIEEYGDMNNWRNVCGTGPFIVIDEIPGSSSTFVKNPNYWMKDPLHPENQLPYPDGIKWMYILDYSTIMAGMRTGKIDKFNKFNWEQGESLLATNPELQYGWLPLSSPGPLYCRVDLPPYNDIRVRKALSMAIDRQTIIDTFYGGNADYYAIPVLPIAEFKDIFIPFEELPDNIREIYEYHPDKAKQLLAEAGYPDGFKTQLVTLDRDVELMAVLKAYLADIGVDAEIKVYEYGAFISTVRGLKYEGLPYYTTFAASRPFALEDYQKGFAQNLCNIDDPFVEETAQKIRENFYNYPEKVRLMKEFVPYALEKCWMIILPNEVRYQIWQPWLGCFGTYSVHNGWHSSVQFYWVNQDIKKEILGK